MLAALQRAGQPVEDVDAASADRLAVEIALQVVGERVGRLVALVWFLLQALEADRLQVVINLCVGEPRRHRIILNHLPDRVERRVALEWRPAREQLVQDRAEAIDVRGRADVAAALRLLGRHITGRAEDGASAGAFPIAVEPLGQAEVGDVRFILAVEQNVRRLQVAMDDPMPVGMMDGPGDAAPIDRRVPAGDRPARQLAGQADPLDELHREEVLPIDLADLEDRDDVRVLQPRRRLGLGAEPLDVLVVREPARQDHLERHDPAQVHLPGAIDHAHTAAGDFGDQLIVAEPLGRRLEGARRLAIELRDGAVDRR